MSGDAMPGPWDELGIAETTDTRAIRRAYAGRLRSIDQQKDPASFQRLRQAYEWALHLATAPEPPVDAPEDQTSVQEQPTEDTPQRELTQDEILTQDMVERIREAMDATRYDIAFDIFHTGSAQGVLPFGYREYLLDAMMTTIVQDAGLSVDQFNHLLERAGWQEPPASTEQIGRVRHYALQRQEADSWFLRLQALADGQGPNMHTGYAQGSLAWRWLRLIERGNARVFFGGRALPKITPAGGNDLRRKMWDYRRRETWLKGRIDPQDAARAQRVLDQFDRYGFLLDPLVAFVLGMIWLGQTAPLEIVLPLVMLGTGLRALVVWRRHSRAMAALKDPA